MTEFTQASSPTSIVSLSSSTIYLASRFADSQLIQLPSSITDEPKADMDDGEESDDIRLLASYASLAPILDCCVVEAEGGGAVSIL